MKQLFLWCFFVVFMVWACLAHAQDVADVSDGTAAAAVTVSSATAGTRIGPDAIKTGLRVRVKEDAAISVCFNYVDRTASCATALTSPTTAAYCATADNGYVFLISEEHFRGQVCAILRSAGSTAVVYNSW